MTTKTQTKIPNYWVITKDYDPTEEAEPGTNGNAKGLRSHNIISDENFARLTLRFRLLDDDGNVYYDGLMVPFKDHDDFSSGFEPLGDFGGPNAGCTSLEYFDAKTDCWELL